MGKVVVAGTDISGTETLGGELEALGYEIVEARDGQAAMEAAAGEDVVALFLWTNLPVFDGYETCGMIRRDPYFSPEFPVIMLSSEPRDTRRMEKCGATAFLPVRHEDCELRELLGNFLY